MIRAVAFSASTPSGYQISCISKAGIGVPPTAKAMAALRVTISGSRPRRADNPVAKATAINNGHRIAAEFRTR